MRHAVILVALLAGEIAAGVSTAPAATIVAAAATPMPAPMLFAAKCAVCHQANGQGTLTVPPLAGNPDVAAADPKNMIATIVNGRSGSLSVNGKTYQGTMPTWRGRLSNSDIASVATYVRNAWGNHASSVTEQQVATSGSTVQLAIGSSLYAAKCSVCHGASGQGGGGGMFPTLAGDKKVTASDPSAMLATIKNGSNAMPAWKGELSATDIAAVATFLRAAWGNAASPITETDVSAAK